MEGSNDLSSYKMPTRKRRKRRGSSMRSIEAKERFYKRNFYIFEVGFIVIAVPVLLIALTSIPILVYFTITQYFQLWPFIILGASIAFFQMLSIQVFVKKFYLKPYNMTFGEYLRFRFDERTEKIEEEAKPPKTWYDNLDEFIVQIRTTQREQTYRIYATNYENVNISA